MKVIFFLDTFPVPSETFILYQIAGVIDLGAEVEIVAVNQGDILTSHKVLLDYELLRRTHFLNKCKRSKNYLSIFACRALKVIPQLWRQSVRRALNWNEYGKQSKNLLLPSICAQQRYTCESDIIIAHFGHVGVLAHKLIELKVLKGKLLTVFHGADISRYDILSSYKNDFRKLFKSSAALLPISYLWKKRLQELGCEPDKIIVNRMGIDLAAFTCRPFEQPISKPLSIVSVARFIEKKGLSDAIEAMKILKSRYVDFHYRIIGDGPLLHELEQQIVAANLSEKIEIIGFQSQENIRLYLESSDVFLLPSVTSKEGDMEGIPVALMEAMAMGLIAISTLHSGIPELIEHGVTGLLAPEYSPDVLCHLLCELNDGKFSISSIRRAALDKVTKEFNQTFLYQELFALCKIYNGD